MAKVDTYQHPELGQALRFLRARSGLSQARVADQVSARGGRLTAVWLSRIESAADRGGGPYPSVVLLDRILAVLGPTAPSWSGCCASAPGGAWGRAPSGKRPRRRRRSRQRRASQRSRRGGAAAPPPRGAAPDIAAEAAELGARYARLPRAAQLELLARARELS